MFKLLTSHLQTRLIVTFILVLLVPSLAIGFVAVTAQANSLTDQARASELAASQAISTNITNLFNRAVPDLLFLANTPFIHDYADAVLSGDPNAVNTALNTAPEIYQSFSYPNYVGIYDSVRLLDSLNHEVLHLDYWPGQIILVTPTRQLNTSDSGLFHETFPLPAGQVYAEQMTLKTTNTQVMTPYQPIIRLATPIFNTYGKRALGVLVLTMNTKAILDAVKTDNPSQSAYLIDSAGTYLAGPDSSKLFGPQLHPGTSFFTDRPKESTAILTGNDGTQFGSPEAPTLFQSFTHINLPGLAGIHWTVYRSEPISVVLNSVNTVRLGIGGLTLLALLIAIGIALLVTRTIVRPVQRLATAAAGLSQGEWNTALPEIKTHDELGALGAAFAVMTRELRALYANLEDRVRARTSELETVAKVSAAITSILNVDELLKNVSELTKANFGLYHAHIYLLGDDRQNLVLAAGAGEAGEKMKAAGHRIPLAREQSLVARAARTRRGVTVNDVTQAPDFLPNPALPNTHSELAVPMVVGNALIGVLDVQSEEVGRFTDADVRVQTTLASQIAVAVQNARAYTQVEQNASALNLDRQRVERLAMVSAALSQATDERQIMASVTMSLDNTTDASLNLAYMTVDAAGTPVEAVSMFNWPELPTPLTPVKYAINNDPFIELWLNNPNKVVFVEDIDTEERLNPQIRALLHSRGSHTIVLMPLYFANVWQGMLTLTWPTAHSFSFTERAVLEALPGPAAAVLANRRAYLAEEEARRESQALYRISEGISAAQNEQDLMNGAARPLSDATTTSINLVLWENSDFDAAAVYEIVADWVRNDIPSQRGSKGLIEHFPLLNVMNRDHLVWSEDTQSDPQIDQSSIATLGALGIRTYLAVPLTLGQRWLGILSVYGDQPRQYDDRQRRRMDAIAKQMAVAVERMALQRQTERRASELATVAQVSAATTTLLNTDELLQSVADLTKDRFGLYHAHIYLLDEAAQSLILVAGAGEAGRQMKISGHRIPLTRQQSLVARAARTQQAVIVNDVTQAPDFLPNPLLPDTRAEMSVPMVVGDRVIGVLDMQSEKVGRFTEEDMRVKTTLADQIAVAVQNARLYEAQVHTAEQLREVDRLKSEFLASMSHELRTPLNSIIGFSEVLADGLDGDLSEEAHTDVLAIHESGEHLLELINDVLDLAKIEAGRMELDRTDVELAEIVEEVGRTTAVLLKDKPVEMVYDLPLDLPVLNADAKRLRQVLKNLVSNAAKFTEQGQIVISAMPTEDHQFVQVSVRDSGVGIAPQNLGLIFEQFRQVDNSSTRKVGGTGLGLPITRQLVQMHGGEIWVTSEPGVGSTFTFTMPVVSEAVAK